ncbi:DUF4367 domain-containing protein [Paenibacillus macerans]|uniref:DUF4367 domain-containing protein n=1 Tax=Paenibacillus macerans TaxID=44252 RepID=UPI00203E91DD|nr:DUF4367 domain-containing protein [Paenibacillus macerans]MCM3698926.1 DUF4367 domain-containing protein [Paenibacillus macerans]
MRVKGNNDKFLRDMEACQHGAVPGDLADTKENRELLELGQALSNKDFSQHSNRSAVLFKVRTMNNKQEANTMKNKRGFKRPAIALSATLAAGVLSIAIAQPSFAQDIVDKVLASFNLGHIEVVQTEPQAQPPESTGKQSVKKEERDPDIAEHILSIKDTTKLADYADFPVKLPQYLPEGYDFDRAEFYRDAEEVSGKYVSLYFINKETKGSIFMQQRLPDEETAFSTGTDGKVEEVQLNGVKAILMDNSKLFWETKDALYDLSSRNVDRNEIIRIAESIR